MRILMISDVYFPRVNGVSTSIRTFRRELTALGHHVRLIVPNYEVACEDDVDILRVPSRGVPRDPEDRMMRRKSIDRLLSQLSKDRFDIVHIQTPFVAHYAGIYLAKQLRVPTIESYHTFFEEYLHHYVPFVPRNVMRLIARRVTVSQCNAVDRIISPS
ncbi:MAG TPA: glycosyltransferase, partial [Steroidobacteraceae bacterium]|nr:glycosyltransferase [Steroidobacteraceae bacterium]